ncbi:flagellar hook-basal body complex protein FliE [Maledivibacter halophilus]|uniref:Flagellar hook-basal body complex protein FliE n=1 Tax=Maledivibacter halophilus TaxID=36842 RepID=A0A1T5LEP0_9FIRM|nr:flagellar hook-basal body complex protein FliE [Maledivibacter halophilus]SKC74461.1 flagellar hook-basal body complex protein FliE [Maledivibacter halophilus]
MKIANIENPKLLNTNFYEKEKVGNGNFKEFLLDSIEKLNTYESDANELGIKLVAGEVDNVHEVMIASQKAEIALQFGIEIKNKVMDAYKEIMRMQV